ncbi:MAG: hypothetical protein RR458_01110 [Clostridia bacterium]
MVNYRKIKNVLIVILSLGLVANLFGYFMSKIGSVLPLTANAIALLLVALMTISTNRSRSFAKKAFKANKDSEFKFLSDKIGYQIVVETIMSEFQGTLVEVDKAWIKIKDRGMGNKIHLLKSNMVTFIIIK